MKTYLAAHDDFVACLNSAGKPSVMEVEQHLRELALCAANRGMSEIHWTFVVDGLIAYVNRHWPGDIMLSSAVARGFDFAAQWETIRTEAKYVGKEACEAIRQLG